MHVISFFEASLWTLFCSRWPSPHVYSPAHGFTPAVCVLGDLEAYVWIVLGRPRLRIAFGPSGGTPMSWGLGYTLSFGLANGTPVLSLGLGYPMPFDRTSDGPRLAGACSTS